MLRLVLAVLHLLALGIGLGAIYARARHLSALSTPDHASGKTLARVFHADNWWAVAAMLWVSTGLWRAFAGTEKASAYYWAQPVFWTKMGLLGLILLLELWPMITLIRWRVAETRGQLPAMSAMAGHARIMARISHVQIALSVAMVVTASMLARGYGAR
jgi:putative membrane protein